MSASQPLEDPVEEARRVVEAADEAGLTVRLIGGTAIHEHAESAREEPFKRGYRDVDFVALREEEDAVVDLMTDLGYEANRRFNTMRRYRLEFYDEANDRKADYIIDKFQFCHEWSLRKRIERDHPTVPIEDLLLSKMQIVEPSERDMRDIVAMLADHPVGDGQDDTERIDPGYIAGLCSSDWGLYKTITMNLDKVKRFVTDGGFPVEESTIVERLDAIRVAVETQPKSLRWKLRSLIGERKQWYDRPELT